jgi:uncharacterized protein YuzE
MLKITYDPAVDALYLELNQVEAGHTEARPLTDEIVANYGPDGQLVGLEILEASHVWRSTTGGVIFEIAPSVAGNAIASVAG